VRRKVLCAILAIAGLAGATAPAHAAAIRSCPGIAEGGGFHHVTTRLVSCARARSVAHRIMHDVTPCVASEGALGSCAYRRGVWSVHGRWFHDRYGLDQLDLRATASGGRVVRLQTDWDGE
jgi:hypothetical protein